MTSLVLSVIFIGAVIAAIAWMAGIGRARQEARLQKICQGDRDQAERLIRAEQSRSPGISREEAAARAAQRYERDNR